MKAETFFTPSYSDEDNDSFDPNDDREPDKYVSEIKVKPQILRNIETVTFAVKSRKTSVGETGGSVHSQSLRTYMGQGVNFKPEKYLA